MGSSNLTARIGAMAFSVVAAVASLRLTYLLSEIAATFYIDSLILTFQNTSSFSNVGSMLLLVLVVTGFVFWFKRHPLDAVTWIMCNSVLFIIGIWITTLGYSSVQYDTAPWWSLFVIGINVIITMSFIAIPLSLIIVFMTQVLRPV